MPYEKVFRKFEVAGVRYLVVGGIAVNLHGYACVTVDLDRMLDLSRDNSHAGGRLIGQDGLRSPQPVHP